MIRLTNEQWERIRNHFPEEHIPMDVLDASRSRPDVFSKLYCGYSTLARSGTCCRKAIRTTNPFIGAFKTWCRDEVLRRVLMDVANELRGKGALDEAECFIDATFVMAKGGGAQIGPTKRGKGMKIMAIVDRHGLPLSVSTHAPIISRPTLPL